ncbi:nucleotidyltransferase domain-containing protein [Streptomyces yaizuensis]|uniref:DNA polymerase subunit beta n=1 Tax=Streptomyces yaizuensis TaxID=2989713 RepID=A0ABQ5NTY1_9ACTN|nr:nucleotidyltransferase domain-containing protein [Streptomyces sp. YSPA8]GLF93635.1 DNA polymerase subunit beta [Streptomyces sp. YSPA8]
MPHSPSPSPSSTSSSSPLLDRRIERLRAEAEAEPRLTGVLLYGSWTVGEADAHSDIEAYLYVRDDAADTFDGAGFLARIAPLELAYTNLYGVLAVVFDDLMRGEFHIAPAGPGIAEIADWHGAVHLPRPDRAVLLDRTGALTRAAHRLTDCPPPDPAPTAQRLTDELANWTLMFAEVQSRGETARAHALLHTVVAPHQLQLLRLLRGSTAHWLTPSRALESDLPPADAARYTTTSRAHGPELRAAGRASWRWSRELSAEAAARWGIRVPSALYDGIDRLL